MSITLQYYNILLLLLPWKSINCYLSQLLIYYYLKIHRLLLLSKSALLLLYYSIEVSLKFFHVLNWMNIAFNVREFLISRISKSAPFWLKHFPPILKSLSTEPTINKHIAWGQLLLLVPLPQHWDCTLLLLILLLDCLLLLLHPFLITYY